MLSREQIDAFRRGGCPVVALEPFFDDRRRPRTLQRLSATFRRADLVEMLRT